MGLCIYTGSQLTYLLFCVLKMSIEVFSEKFVYEMYGKQSKRKSSVTFIALVKRVARVREERIDESGKKESPCNDVNMCLVL